MPRRPQRQMATRSRRTQGRWWAVGMVLLLVLQVGVAGLLLALGPSHHHDQPQVRDHHPHGLGPAHDSHRTPHRVHHHHHHDHRHSTSERHHHLLVSDQAVVAEADAAFDAALQAALDALATAFALLIGGCAAAWAGQAPRCWHAWVPWVPAAAPRLPPVKPPPAV